MPDPRLLVTINDRLARAELELQRRPSQAEVDELRQRLVSHEEALDSARLRIANLTQVLRNVADAARASQSRDQQVASELDGIRELASRLTATADKVRVQDWGWRELLEQVTALTNSPRTGANESVDR
jgi:chromosome segregation ATPase